MTPAEQVACDALRSAGLDEVADNLAFAREAVRLRERIMEDLTCDVDSQCTGCGVVAFDAHKRTCRLMPLLVADPAWLPVEIEHAHEEALRESRLRATPLFGVDPRLPALSEWGLSNIVTGAIPQTPAGRLAVAQSLIDLGTIPPEHAAEILGADTLRDLKK